ncbi:MAG: oligosaccharide flippase family protein [Sandaracinaceae bacterium]
MSEAERAPSRWKRLVLRGSLFELGGYVTTYGLRFVSSTILRSLLFPAAFGVMEVVNGVMIGLIMLSDVGIQQAIIQSERGDERDFLDTAWTLHVIRGLGLWLVACLIAYPASLLAGEPELVELIPVASLGVLLLGFHTTAEFTLRRRMTLGRVILMEVLTQGITVTVTIGCAVVWPSVWALVIGGLTSATVRLLFSHYLARLVGYRNRFHLHADSRKEIFEFGKWITASSAVFFAASWGDRLLMVSFLGARVAGIYATAVLIAESVSAALDKVIHGVFYPLFSRVGREGTDALRSVYYATRLRFDAMTLTLTGGLAAMGPWVIGLLFDPRYATAGWMLRVLCVRAASMAIVAPAETCLTSLGHTRYGFYQNVLRAAWILIGVPIGYVVGGAEGVVWVAALSAIPPLFALWPKLRSLGILRLEREALAVLFFAAGYGVAYALTLVLPEASELRDAIKALLAPVRGG